ncbi:GAP family protein [Actinomadura mexicana]|uniref:Sap, sulfolipid-1-addressing protein n=1 Tax=Actinomadura mexicana TaxID=134959 RepID=A0A239CA43_9ACTN|nr:GAP family protein [Actinomadura mexicana]SNS16829.1 Sap, sulfolipid-1-addressing protein [Actinomadura mexicana]
MSLQVLPLAITMMAGPQIMSAIILVTTPRPVRASLAFLAGVAVSASAGTAAARGVFALVGGNVSIGSASDDGSVGKIVQYALIALLLLAILRNYVKRATIEPPKWLGSLMHAGPGRAFRTGLLLIILMPSDLIVMLTVGANLEQHHEGAAAAAVFVGATLLIAALPLLALLLFHRRAERAMPRVREWMTGNSWVINIICCLIFIAIIH